jgi:membrane-associated phospholipid phosphatase
MTLRAIARPATRVPAIERPARPLYWAIVAIWAVLLTCGRATGMTIDSDFLLLLVPIGLLIMTSAALKQRGLVAVGTAIECSTMLATAAVSFVLLSFLLGRSGAPYADPVLDAAERTLFPGFDWPSAVEAFCRMDVPLRIANIVYNSLWWQMLLLVGLLCATGKRVRCWDFALAWALSLSFTLVVFAAAPAMGAYGFHHIPHAAVSGVANQVGWRQPVVLEHLRHAAAIKVHPQDMAGIVEFPSFHTASAVLFAWGFWAVRPARFVAIPLNIGVAFASVPIGGHYLPDILGGVVVAMLGIAAMRAWRSVEAGDFGRKKTDPAVAVEATLQGGL